MGITESLRRIWLFSANKIKSSESFSKQPTQIMVELNSSLGHIIVTIDEKRELYLDYQELILSQTLGESDDEFIKEDSNHDDDDPDPGDNVQADILEDSDLEVVIPEIAIEVSPPSPRPGRKREIQIIMPKTPDVEQQSPISGSDCQSETEMNMPQIQITVVSPPRSPESPISTNSESTSPLPSPISPPIKSTRYVYELKKYHKKSFQQLTMFLMSTCKNLPENELPSLLFEGRPKQDRKVLDWQTCTRLQFFVCNILFVSLTYCHLTNSDGCLLKTNWLIKKSEHRNLTRKFVWL